MFVPVENVILVKLFPKQTFGFLVAAGEVSVIPNETVMLPIVLQVVVEFLTVTV